MQTRAQKTNVSKKNFNLAALAAGTTRDVWSREEKETAKRLNHIQLLSEPSSRLAKVFDA